MAQDLSHSTTADIQKLERAYVDRASELASRSRVLLRRRAIALWLTLVLICCAILILFDAYWRFEETGLRFLVSCVALVLAAYGFKVLVLPAWRFSPTKNDAAKWLDRNADAEHSDNQTLTLLELAELDAEDRRFGSQGFRRAAVTQSLHDVSSRDWNTILSERAATRPLSVLVFVMLLLGCCFLLSPSLSWIGVKRLALPFAPISWPKNDQLEFVDLPAAIALGNPLRIEVMDRVPPLPAEVILESRFRDEPSQVFRQTMEAAENSAYSTIMQTQAALEVRALGGEDQSMDWKTVQVVRAPELTSFRFLVEPPKYVNQQRIELVSRNIQVLRGSRVKLVAEIDDSVQSVELLSEGVSEEDGAEEEQSSLRAKLDSGGRRLIVGDEAGDSWVASRSVSWQLNLTTKDRYSVAMPDRWTINVVDDAAPSVQLEEAELPFLTTGGRLSLVGRASDDMGLSEVIAKLRISSSQSEEPVIVSSVVWEAAVQDALPTDVRLESSISPEQLANMSAVSSLSVWLEATDSKGQIARSEERVFSIREASEVVDALGDQVSGLVEKLAAIVASQQRNLSLSLRASQVIAQTKTVAAADLEALLNVSQIQESLAQQLSEGEEGLVNGFQKLSEHFEANGLTESAQYGQIRSVAAALENVANREMEKAVSGAYQAYQFAKSVSDSQSSIDEAALLQDANRNYEDLLAELRKILDRLNRTEASKQLREDLAQLLAQQEQLQSATTELQFELLSQAPRTLVEANKVRLSVEQQDLSRQLESLIQRANQAESAPDLGGGQYLSGGQSGMTDVLQKESTAATMRMVAKEISAEQLVDAKNGQSKVIRELEQALSISREQQDNFASQQASALQELGNQLRQLAEQQSQLANQIESGAATLQELKSRQRELTNNVGERASEMRADAPQTSEKLSEINQSQREFENNLKNLESGSAASMARDLASQLEQLANELLEESSRLAGRNRRRQVQELLSQIQDAVREQAVVSAKLQRLGNEDVIGRTELASDQDVVRELTENIESETRGVPAFGWTIQKAVQDMLRVSAAARRNRLSDAQVSALRALDRLQMALAALESENSNRPSNQGNGNAQPTDAEGQKLPSLASLKLLRSLQMSINNETRDLNQRALRGVQVGGRLAELAAEQKELGLQLEAILQALGSKSDDSNRN